MEKIRGLYQKIINHIAERSPKYQQLKADTDALKKYNQALHKHLGGQQQRHNSELSNLEKKLNEANHQQISSMQQQLSQAQEQIHSYKQQLAHLKEQNQKTQQLAQQVLEDTELANRRMIASLLASKQGFSPLLTDELKKFPVRKELIKATQSLQRENENYAHQIEESQEEISRLQTEIKETQKSELLRITSLLIETTREMKDGAIALYHPNGKQITQTHQFEKYSKPISSSITEIFQDTTLQEEIRKRGKKTIRAENGYRVHILTIRPYANEEPYLLGLSLIPPKKQIGRKTQKIFKTTTNQITDLMERLGEIYRQYYSETSLE